MKEYNFKINDMEPLENNQWLVVLDNGKTVVINDRDLHLPEGNYILPCEHFEKYYVHPNTGLIRFVYIEFGTDDLKLTDDIDIYDTVNDLLLEL